MTTVVMSGFKNETRQSFILAKRAKKIRQETSRDELQMPQKMQERGLPTLFKVALADPSDS